MKTTSPPLHAAFAAALIATAASLPQAQAITIAHGGDSVDIDFVDIGNAGNAADSTGYGAVAYDYSIGTYEITADQWAAVSSYDANIATGVWQNYYSSSQPTGNTSWYEAAKFANWLTSGDALSGAYQFSDATTFTGVDRATALTTYGAIFVLPSEDEWYKAAYLKSDGSGYTLYATGDTTPDGIDFNGDTTYDSVFNDQFPVAGLEGTPYAVGGGSIENNGTYDMGGNSWELIESAFTGGEPTGGESRVIRGGYKSTDVSYMQSTSRIETTPSTEYPSYGFRVAAINLSVVPEPSSVGLLVIGAMGCVMRRKRS